MEFSDQINQQVISSTQMRGVESRVGLHSLEISYWSFVRSDASFAMKLLKARIRKWIRTLHSGITTTQMKPASKSPYLPGGSPICTSLDLLSTHVFSSQRWMPSRKGQSRKNKSRHIQRISVGSLFETWILFENRSLKAVLNRQLHHQRRRRSHRRHF